MNHKDKNSFTFLLLASLVLTGCSSGTDESADSASTLVDTNPVGTTLPANQVEFRLASFSDFNLGPVRSFPTDRTPILKMSTDTTGAAEFAISGSGAIYARCNGLAFEYQYEQDANAGRNRFTIDGIERLTQFDEVDCEPGIDVFESAAYEVALPLFSNPDSLLSDLSETLLTVYGNDSQSLNFQLGTESPMELETETEVDATLSPGDFRWTVLAYRFGANRVTPAPATDPLAIQFYDDGNLAGNLLCHSLSGGYEVEVERAFINFSNVSFTDNSCTSEPDNISSVASTRLQDAVAMVMGGTASAIQQGQRLYLSGNEITLVLEGREEINDERALSASVIATGEYPLPDAETGPIDERLIQTVRDTDTFNALWNEAVALGNDLGTPPAVNFDQSLVMYMRLGVRPHLGESITLRSAYGNDEQALIEVDTRISDNDVRHLDDCAYDAALAHPFRFVLVSDTTTLPDTVAVIDHQSSACSGL